MATLKHHAHGHRYGTGDATLSHSLPVQKFALALGAVFLLVGIMGFIPGLLHAPHNAPPLTIDANHGRLLGLFTVNVLHNLVHLAVGVAGLLGSRSYRGAVGFSRGLAIFYGLLALMGLFPATYTMFGLVPIHGHDVWLHAVTALIAAYFGFGPPARGGLTRDI